MGSLGTLLTFITATPQQLGNAFRDWWNLIQGVPRPDAPIQYIGVALLALAAAPTLLGWWKSWRGDEHSKSELEAALQRADAVESDLRRLQDQDLPQLRQEIQRAEASRAEWQRRYEDATAVRKVFATDLQQEFEAGTQRWVAVCTNVSGAALTNVYARVKYFDGDGDPRGNVDFALVRGPRDILPHGAPIRVTLLGRVPKTNKRFGLNMEESRTEIPEIANKIELTVYADGLEQSFRFTMSALYGDEQPMRVTAVDV